MITFYRKVILFYISENCLATIIYFLQYDHCLILCAHLSHLKITFVKIPFLCFMRPKF